MNRSVTYGSFGSLPELVRAASNAPLLDPEEDRRLAREAREGQDEALDSLVKAHLRLVVDEAIRHRDHFVRTGDLVSRGLKGLHWAAPRFDPEVHESFWTYARQAVRAEIRKTDRPD